MALIIQASPTTRILSRNPIVWKFRAQDVFGTPYGSESGVSVELQTPDTYFVENDTLTVQWTESDGTIHAQTFTAKDTPTAEDEFQAASVDPYATYLASIAEVINSHPKTSPFFTAVFENDDPIFKIVITAREADDNWSVNIIPVTSHSVMIVQDGTVTLDNTPDNYRVNFEVYYETAYNSGIFSKIASLQSYPDADANVFFDIQNVIYNAQKDFRTTPDVPNYSNGNPYIADNLRRFFIRYNEASGTPLVAGAWTYSIVITSMLGGIAQADWLNDEEFFPNITSANAWLTYYPNRKKIHEEQPEHLAWYNWTGGDVTASLEISEYDDTNIAATKSVFSFAVPDGQTAIFPIGKNALSLASTTQKFTVTLKYGGNTGANARTYFLDRSYQEQSRFIFYFNGFGCPECLMTRGHYEKALSVNRSSARRIVSADENGLFRETKQYQSDFQNPFKVRSGYLSDREVEALQELLIYNEGFEVSVDGNRGLHILSDDFEIFNSFQFLNQIEFTAIYALSDGGNYTNNFATEGTIYVIGDPDANEIIGDGINVIGY